MFTGAAFCVAFAVCIMLAYRSGSPALIRTGWAMLGNFAAVWVVTVGTGYYAPWLWFIAIDVLTAFVVLSHPASRPQAVIGAIYVAQIIAHVAFGAANTAEHIRLYLDLLAFGGACQLLILATGAIHGRRGKADLAWAGGGIVARARAADSARVEKRP